ncbi:MAG TPA: hypothetical protein IGS52_19855 [Oscillatoriaceae cyanobacterium M33_DOE_052]|uniref:Uncharacterized protein n=1 Tax=Planktothricoides sp. SpSt-374 TaxID=2282167 RepID=A0A7C3ZK92_9CYAN|nr:hypothetical protein [Oscillatoriaceae cyanobacterium M33_DOE_052]
MSDIAILKEMINQSATVPLLDKYGKKQVILREPAPANYAVTIYGMPNDDDVIIIKADAFISNKAFFQGKQGECKRADFVIIADTGQKKVIVCLEMKWGKGGTEAEIIHQLKGAQCLVTYCREIGRSFWNLPNFMKDYVYRFVSIRDISIAKKPTRSPSNTPTHDRPDKMLKISSPHHLTFDSLIS